MIVVTTPTGQIGQHVTANLIAAGMDVRVVIRDASKLEELAGQVEVIEGSHGDPSVIDRALEGAEALFWLAPPDPGKSLEEAYLVFTRPAAEAIRRNYVKRVVSVTALGRGTAWQHRAGLVTASIGMDDLLIASGVSFRGLAMPSFMDNLLRQAISIREEGLFYGPIDPDLKAPVTATQDIGLVAARLLADSSWTGQGEQPVLGPEDLSFDDMAEVISDVIGRKVRYQQTTFDSFKAQLVGRGMSESFAQGYVDMMRAKNEGMDNVAERDATSGTPTSFRRWCQAALKPAVLGPEKGARP